MPATAQPLAKPTAKKEAPKKEPAAKAPARPSPPRQNAILSADDLASARAALQAAEAGKWDAARVAAQRTKSDLPLRLVTWLQFQRPGNGAGFEAIAGFIRNHADWPAQDALQRRAEESLDDGVSDARVADWFADRRPLTGEGMYRHGAALLRLGHAEQGQRALRDAWVNGNFSTRDEAALFGPYDHLLTPDDHWARLDRLLWERQVDAARRLMPRVTEPYRLLADARLALSQKGNKPDILVERVPATLRNDGGLIYELLRYRRETGLSDRTDEALLVPTSRMPHAERWWNERHIRARAALGEGRITDAYALASNHGPLDNRSLVEAEWLAGWIALRFLNEPQTGLKHFLVVFEQATFPVSKARAAYWIGRSAEALKEEDRARQWYEEAAQHNTTFYGQLALVKLERTHTLLLPQEPAPGPAAIARFNQRSLVQATRVLAELEQLDRLRAFILRLQDTAKSFEEHALVSRFAREMGRTDLSVAAAKRSHQRGVLLVDGSFPIVPALKVNVGPETAVVMGISRQESEFNQFAISRAGARGLMQLMPATAREVARNLSLPFSNDRLLSDGDYNARLGGKYLADLIERWDGNLPMAFAAYNAGEGRVRRWVREWGDPRWSNVDVVDWIESIPFSETRNYVQRAMENVQVYRSRLAPGTPLTIAQDLRGRLVREANDKANAQ